MCDGTNHDLVVIYRAGYDDDEQHVVKWCTYCGAVCVDLEYDYRPMAIVMPMRFPQLLYNTISEQRAKRDH